MARIRTIKPEFFRHEGLQDLAAKHGAHVMLVFAGLWGHCDRAGRFEWRPRTLKLDILPFLEFDMEQALTLLEQAGFIERYEVDGKQYGSINSFTEHQNIGGKERDAPLKLPANPLKRQGKSGKSPGSDGEVTQSSQVVDIAEKQSGSDGEVPGKQLGTQEGNGLKGREGEGNGETREARASPTQNQNLSASKPNQEPRKGSRWPSEAVVPDDWLGEGEAYRETAGLPPIDLRAEALKFANYWASKAGGGATKIDWKRTWLNWVLQANGGRNGTQGQSGKSAHPGGFFGQLAEDIRAKAG